MNTRGRRPEAGSRPSVVSTRRRGRSCPRAARASSTNGEQRGEHHTEHEHRPTDVGARLRVVIDEAPWTEYQQRAGDGEKSQPQRVQVEGPPIRCPQRPEDARHADGSHEHQAQRRDDVKPRCNVVLVDVLPPDEPCHRDERDNNRDPDRPWHSSQRPFESLVARGRVHGSMMPPRRGAGYLLG